MRNLLVGFVLSLALLLSGCESFNKSVTNAFFGPAETDAQRGYRLVGIYNYVSLPVADYVYFTDARPELVRDLCILDQSVYSSMVAASTEIASSGDIKSAALQAVATALIQYSLTVVGEENPLAGGIELANRTVVLAALGATSITKMRTYRQIVLEPKMNSLQEENRDPTEEEWNAILNRATSMRQLIAEKCPTMDGTQVPTLGAPTPAIVPE